MNWMKGTDRFGQPRFDAYRDGNHIGSITRTQAGFDAFRSGDGADQLFSFTAYSVVDRPEAERVATQLGRASRFITDTPVVVT